MKQAKTFLILFLAVAAHVLWAQQRLAFSNGKFKIAQFTDIHWDARSANCTQTEATIRAVIEAEKPRLAVLTGDIVTEKPALEGWKSIIRIFETARLPFVVTMGNHDAEAMPKQAIYRLLIQSPYYVGTRGPEQVSGFGNCIIPICATEAHISKTEALLYCIDSNDYQPVKEYGAYDWIHFDEIAWYRNESAKYTQSNGGKPLPALAFFHIPLLEYNNVVAGNDYLGSYGDGEVCSSMINSGMFASFIDCKDVMGVFCGHDHENDFVGMERGIALGYGRVSGWDAYGNMERGCRIIELYQGQRKFNTWVRTPHAKGDTFYYPSALTSKEEQNMTYLPAKNCNPNRQGVAFTYYEGTCKHTKDIVSMQKKEQGIMQNFSIAHAKQADHFGYVFRTLIKIDQRGVYRFYTYSDDGTKLLIDNTVVVDNDGGHSARRADGKVALEAGYHELELRYFEDYMGQALEVGYSGRDIMETV
ncbi:MAG TPA: metallophosphoesterase, partial [Prevotella sp.]